jgi:hypothetical protein
MSDVKATFEKIQASFQEGADLGDLSASYLFKLTGDDGGEWSISIEDGKGSANAQMLFMSGKLKVAGNMGLALKLQKVLGSAR